MEDFGKAVLVMCPAAIVDRSEHLAEVERLEATLLQLPQVECPVTHSFAPGVYMREIFMPAGSFVIGHEHKTEHLNVVLTGSARVMMDSGEVVKMEAPLSFVSQAGVRKILYIESDMRFLTIHPNVTDETDVAVLEDRLIEQSATFLEHQRQQLLKFQEIIQLEE